MQRIVPSKTELRRYLERGLSQSKIAAEYEKDTGIRVSRSAIGMAIARYGLKSSRDAPRYEDMLPWQIAPEHKMHKIARLLRLEGRRREGNPLSEEELRWLEGFVDDLNESGEVVDYHPSVGFVRLKRGASDTPGEFVRRPMVDRTAGDHDPAD